MKKKLEKRTLAKGYDIDAHCRVSSLEILPKKRENSDRIVSVCSLRFVI